jgi:P pilus assembly chaperone PapD
MLGFGKKEQSLNLFAASILLIVLMVPASVAVNVLTEPQANKALLTERLTVSSVIFSGGSAIHLRVNNSGTLNFAVAEVWVNSERQAFTTNPAEGQMPPNGSMEISVSYAYVNGTSYHVKIVSDRGNEYFASATAL